MEQWLDGLVDAFAQSDRLPALGSAVLNPHVSPALVRLVLLARTPTPGAQVEARPPDPPPARLEELPDDEPGPPSNAPVEADEEEYTPTFEATVPRRRSQADSPTDTRALIQAQCKERDKMTKAVTH